MKESIEFGKMFADFLIHFICYNERNNGDDMIEDLKRETIRFF